MKEPNEKVKPPLLTVTQVAERLNVSVFMIYRLADLGDLPTIWIRSRRRFDPDDLEKWIQDQKKTHKPGYL